MPNPTKYLVCIQILVVTDNGGYLLEDRYNEFDNEHDAREAAAAGWDIVKAAK